MRLYAPVLFAVCAISAIGGAASAAPRELNDPTYLAVAQCAGMAQGMGVDATPFTTVLDADSGARTSDVMDRAEETRSEAKFNASRAGPDGKAGITRKLDTTCKSYISAG